MAKGTVYHCTDFEFKDGARKDKYLVQLNEPGDDEPYLVCTTTSQLRNRKLEPACQPERSEYVLKAGHDFFPKATLVQLHAIYEQDRTTLLQHALSGRMREMQQLRPETIGAIANCAARCDDVSEYHRQLICRKACQ